MLRKVAVSLLKLAASLVFFVLILELMLYVFDPYGFHYLVAAVKMLPESEPIDGLVQYNPGVYRYRGFAATIQADRTRLVPDTNLGADCTIVMLGDSVTFGHGVNDDETFTNVLAREFQQARFINTAMVGYNSHQILEMSRRYPDADGFVYLIVGNDPNILMLPEKFTYKSYIVNYAAFVAGKHPAFPNDFDRFYTDMDTLASDSRILLVSYGTLDFLTGYDVLPLDIHEHEYGLSRMDTHPNPAGHRDLARQLAPFVEQLINEVCNG